MQLDIHALMNGLAERRPIFHSEADFQFALAWRIHKTLPDCEVRLEFKPFPSEGMYLDVWLPTEGMAIELKYRTSELDIECSGERFVLAKQDAQDEGRYYTIEDIRRIERVVSKTRANAGFVIILTNDRSYWKPPSRKNATQDANFRIHEGRKLSGKLAWQDGARKRTMKREREAPISLKGSYTLNWRDYSRLRAERNARFRYLAVSVGDLPS